MNNLSDKQEEILSLLEKYNCLDISQVYAMYEPLDRTSVDKMVNMLIGQKYITILDGHILALAGNDKIDVSTLSCIWTMIQVSNERAEIIKSFPAAEPAFSYMVVNNKDSYLFVNATANDTVKIRAVQERIAKEKKQKNFNTTYIFVTTDDNVKKIVKETDFDSTVYVSMLTYDQKTKVPSIKMLRKKSEKDT